jgi:hypothetical protein
LVHLSNGFLRRSVLIAHPAHFFTKTQLGWFGPSAAAGAQGGARLIAAQAASLSFATSL